MRHQGGRNRGCDEKGRTLSKDYLFRSNWESGFGRYDVVMEPKDPLRMAVILEFKVLADWMMKKASMTQPEMP